MSAHVLERQTFATSRLAEFCSQKELVAQTGHPVEQWPLVVLKELIDNSLDACEEADIAPVISVAVNAVTGVIAIADNGPGISPETVKRLIDYNVRVSSREAYVSPTRGAQGNALKTLVAMAFALDGTVGETVIEAKDIRHTIRFGINGITREPQIEHTEEPGFVHSGTSVTVRWPNSACSELESAQERFVQIAQDYTWINPHLTLDMVWTDADPVDVMMHTDASEPGWRKWKPSDPTSAHWYDAERLERLAGAYVSNDQDRTVRDFIADFRGMARSAKQKEVLDATGLSRKPLSDLFPNAKADKAAFVKLLDALKSETEPVKPDKLGIIGRDNLDLIQDTDPETFVYKCVKCDGDLPAIIEVAFAYCPEQLKRHLVCGVNWSVGVNNSNMFRDLHWTFEELKIGPDEPIYLIIHVAYPRMSFMDRGKGAVTFPSGITNRIKEALTAVTKAWTRQRKAEERHASAERNRRDRLTRRERVTIKEAAHEIMEAAYLKASGKLGTANARQIMYAARGHILERTERNSLDDAYFTQVLLPDYVAETGVKWDVAYDDRGHFKEPHTDRVIGLGTLAVRRYLAELRGIRLNEPSFAHGKISTHGPQGRYGAILYVEKEGFDSLWSAAQIEKRFDISIMSCKGMSVTAARQLVEAICGTYGMRLFVLHDCDKAGLSIRASFQQSNRRHKYEKQFEVIDLGLRLEDIAGLESEPHSDRGEPEVRAANMRKNGATEEEIRFLLTRRVELNAMTSDQIVAFLERKLTEYGVKKIVPDDTHLASAYKLELRNIKAEKIVRHQLAKMNGDKFVAPADLRTRLDALLQQKPFLSWDEAICDIATDDAAKAAVDASLKIFGVT
jgi:DNA topoisomerase VI subunit B